MDKLLRQIANTMVANLRNTESIGLFNGKMGIALFLYKYARYSGSAIYEDIASGLLDEIFGQLRPNISPNVFDGLGGIGCGLVVLLGECFVESDSEEDVLNDIDRILLCDVRSSCMKDIRDAESLYSSGLYLLFRLRYGNKNEDAARVWITNVITQAGFLLSDCIKRKKYGILRPSFLNSMLYVFLKLSAMEKQKPDTLIELVRSILYLLHQVILQGNCREFDIVLLMRILLLTPPALEKEVAQLQRSVEKMVPVFSFDNMDFWYDYLWWSVIYDDMVIKEHFSLDEIEYYVNKKIEEAYFDESIVNGRLAGVGIWLMRDISQTKQHNSDGNIRLLLT